jgi:hypothetical protein
MKHSSTVDVDGLTQEKNNNAARRTRAAHITDETAAASLASVRLQGRPLPPAPPAGGPLHAHVVGQPG